jgi:myo-inositol-1(or 4)-monophosphatase
MTDRLQFASALAREAGRLAHSAFGRSMASLKGRHDIVTRMDSEVERFIRAEIAKRYPSDAIIGEEEGGASGDGERVWVVDPIDGTANYARGVPRYCVSIGYLERVRPIAGVVYDPNSDQLYAAERGGGAACNGERLVVSPVADLDAATVECGWSTRRSSAEYLALVGRVLGAGCAFSRAGSGALGLADVAAGRREAYCELHINAWDCAAGVLLVEEAGGFANDFFADGGLAGGNPLIATNAALCAKLAAVIGIPIKS